MSTCLAVLVAVSTSKLDLIKPKAFQVTDLPYIAAEIEGRVN